MSGIEQTPQVLWMLNFSHAGTRVQRRRLGPLLLRSEARETRFQRPFCEFAMARLFQTEVSLTPIERPRCERCQTRMMLARIAPLPDGSEMRLFECPKCDAVETKTVADPLKSESVERLTHNVRPPT
jgi:hypothetical protein